MKLRTILIGGALSLLSLAANAATIVVPAAGSARGANDSVWQSDITLHSVAPRPVTVSIEFHQGTQVFTAAPVTLAERQTVLLANVVKTMFGIEGGTGALVFNVDDQDVKSLAITSATYNLRPEGRLGQEIPAINIVNATAAGDLVTLTGPNASESYRFNFGVYAVEAAKVRWELVRADGRVVSTNEITYAAGEHAQYNSGIGVLFASSPQEHLDSVHATVLEGKGIFYGSSVHPAGDPTYVPAIAIREEIVINFLGVDVDENGTIDIKDVNGDGVLDSTMDVYTSGFPAYFRVLAVGEFGQLVTYKVISSPGEAVFQDASGTMRLGTPGYLKDTTGVIVIGATVGTTTKILKIPVRFK